VHSKERKGEVVTKEKPKRGLSSPSKSPSRKPKDAGKVNRNGHFSSDMHRASSTKSKCKKNQKLTSSDDAVKSSKDRDLGHPAQHRPTAPLPQDRATVEGSNKATKKKKKKKTSKQVKSNGETSRKKSEKKNIKKKSASSKKHKSEVSKNMAEFVSNKDIRATESTCGVVVLEDTIQDPSSNKSSKSSAGTPPTESSKPSLFATLSQQLCKLQRIRAYGKNKQDSGLTLEETSVSAEDSISSVLFQKGHRWSLTSSLVGHTSKSFVVHETSPFGKSLSKKTSVIHGQQKHSLQPWYVRGPDQKRPLARNEAFPWCNTMEMIFFEK
jgi:hypothetical protein